MSRRVWLMVGDDIRNRMWDLRRARDEDWDQVMEAETPDPAPHQFVPKLPVEVVLFTCLGNWPLNDTVLELRLYDESGRREIWVHFADQPASPARNPVCILGANDHRTFVAWFRHLWFYPHYRSHTTKEAPVTMAKQQGKSRTTKAPAPRWIGGDGPTNYYERLANDYRLEGAMNRYDAVWREASAKHGDAVGILIEQEEGLWGAHYTVTLATERAGCRTVLLRTDIEGDFYRWFHTWSRHVEPLSFQLRHGWYHTGRSCKTVWMRRLPGVGNSIAFKDQRRQFQIFYEDWKMESLTFLLAEVLEKEAQRKAQEQTTRDDQLHQQSGEGDGTRG